MSFQQSFQAAQIQPCDSYFVESHDEGLYAARADARERARQFARERQLLIAEELSRTTCEEYQTDVLKHMEHMEVGLHHTKVVSCFPMLTNNSP